MLRSIHVDRAARGNYVDMTAYAQLPFPAVYVQVVNVLPFVGGSLAWRTPGAWRGKRSWRGNTPHQNTPGFVVTVGRDDIFVLSVGYAPPEILTDHWSSPRPWRERHSWRGVPSIAAPSNADNLFLATEE